MLRRLTHIDRSWCVWKNADDAVAGLGDVDSAAPWASWPRITDEFRRWAAESGAGPVIVCEHAPGSLVLVVCAPEDRARLLQLDVYQKVGRVVAAEALPPVAELDARGFRRVRPGAEGVLLLLAAARRGGRPPRQPELLARVAGLVRSDPAGAEAAADLLGSGRAPGRGAARAVAEGRWPYGAMAALELVYALQAARRPQERLRWLRFRLGGRQRCPVLAALANDRSISGDVDRWLADVSSNHRIYND